MTVSLSLLAGSGWQFFDNSGNVLTGGLLYSYTAGTTTPVATYTSVTGLTANSNPIVLDAAGRVPYQIWLTDGAGYKFRLENSVGTQIGTWDNITSQNTASTGLSASAISYTAAGSSTVRTVQAKLQESVSVKDFGAIGNSVADDTAAIQLALNAAASTKAAVYIPSGTYKVSSALTVAAGGFLIYGDGADSTIIATNSATSNVFVFGDGITMYSNVYMRDIGFTSSVTPRTAGSYVKFNKIIQGGIENFRTNVGFIAVELIDSILIEVANGYITNPTASTGYGVRIRGGNDHNLRDFIVAGNVSAQCKAAVLIEATGATWLDNVGGLQSGIGLLLQPQIAGDVVEHIFSSRCAWDTCTSHGILMDAGASTTIRRNKFVQDWTASNNLNGVVLNGAGTITDIEFIGHRAYNNKQSGFNVLSGNNIRILGGTVSGNSQTSSNTYDGIVFDNIDGFSVIGVRSGAIAGFANTQRYGIAVNNTASTNFIISNCDFIGNATGAVLSPPVNTSRIIKDNLNYINEATGVATGTTDGSGDITVTHGLAGTPTKIFVQPNGIAAVYIWGTHSITSTTFKVRFFNGASAGAPLTGFALGNVFWYAIL